jgi:hypothetical protein
MGRAGLTATYLLLVLLLNPVLLQHDLSAGSHGSHSDRDVCTWLDHAAGAALQSAEVALSVTETVTGASSELPSFFVFRHLHVDPIRGPPLFL